MAVVSGHVWLVQDAAPTHGAVRAQRRRRRRVRGSSRLRLRRSVSTCRGGILRGAATLRRLRRRHHAAAGQEVGHQGGCAEQSRSPAATAAPPKTR